MMDITKNKWFFALIVAIAALGLVFIGMEYQETKDVNVVLIVYSGTDVIEENTYALNEKGLLQMGTDNDYVYRNNVTSYGITIKRGP